jgi:hypothetical protein
MTKYFILILMLIFLPTKSYSQWWTSGGNLIWPYGNVSVTNGNLNVSGTISSAVKKYVALLSQSGSDSPTAAIIENSLGDVTWSRVEAGFYRASLFASFTQDSTFVLVSSVDRFDFSPPSTFTHNLFTVAVKSIDANNIDITVFDSSGNLVDPNIINIPIEILVYP